MTPKERKAKKARGQRRKLTGQRLSLKLKQLRDQASQPKAPKVKNAKTERRTHKTECEDGEDKMLKAETKGYEAKQKFANIIGTHVKKHKTAEPDRVILRRRLGIGPLDNKLWASDAELRRVAGVFLGEALIKLKRANPGLYFYFWTFINDRGNTSDRHPVVNIKGMQSIADQVFRKLRLSSFSVNELQGIGNYPREGKGRIIMDGIHAITFSEKPLDCAAIMSDLNASTVWTCALGADPVDVQPVGPTDGNLSYLGYYMLKSPYEVKMVQRGDERVRLKGTEKGYKPEFAMRIFEGLSQLEINTIVRSTYDGAQLRADWQRRLMYWHKSRPEWSSNKLPEVDMYEFWQRIRSKKRRVEYAPYRFIM